MSKNNKLLLNPRNKVKTTFLHPRKHCIYWSKRKYYTLITSRQQNASKMLAIT